MEVIPVIDIKDGIVVHARRGERAGYVPIDSPFASSAAPQAVVDGILGALPFSKFYIADLDAIAGHPGNASFINTIASTHPTVEFWLDAGFRHPPAIDEFLNTPNIDLVLATESINSLAQYERLRDLIPPDRTLLSLDRSGNDLLGCAALFERRQLWPDRIIHMNLGVVGTGGGPDWAGLEALRNEAADYAVFAAGGVRDENDLSRLAALGVSGTLVATALHEGRISSLQVEYDEV